MLRLASSVRLARRAFSTEVAPKIDWAELSSFVHSDEAKREIQMLKKSLDDMKEQLAAEAKARRPAARAAGQQRPRVPTGPVQPQAGPLRRSRCRGRVQHACSCRGASAQALPRPFWPPAAACFQRLGLAPKQASDASYALQEPAPIDWAFYRKHITAPGVVDTFEKALKGSRPRLPRLEEHRPAGSPRRARALALPAARGTHSRAACRATQS
jgi:hypothetical protein